MTYLTDAPIDRDSLIRSVYRESDGAIVVFDGVVRNHHDGRNVSSIFYEAYRPMADKEIARVIDSVRSEHPDVAIAVLHRLGMVRVGETSITIVCASPHRADAFDASRKVIDRIKMRVPIWKKEETMEGLVWQGWQQ
jgi:molybdopterin synthase catalytic subunit